MLVRNLPPTSRLSRAVHGDVVAWGPVEHLLASVVDAIRAGNWQRGGGKGPRPKPIQRPGAAEVGEKHMGKARPVAEVRALLDRWRAGELDDDEEV